MVGLFFRLGLEWEIKAIFTEDTNWRDRPLRSGESMLALIFLGEKGSSHCNYNFACLVNKR